MTTRTWTAVVIVVVPLLAYPLYAVASGAPRFPDRTECIRPAAEGMPADVVFGRLDSPLDAEALRDRVESVGFVGTEVLADGCGRWKVVLDNVPTVAIAREVQEEARTVDLETSLELYTGH